MLDVDVHDKNNFGEMFRNLMAPFFMFFMFKLENQFHTHFIYLMR